MTCTTYTIGSTQKIQQLMEWLRRNKHNPGQQAVCSLLVGLAIASISVAAAEIAGASRSLALEPEQKATKNSQQLTNQLVSETCSSGVITSKIISEKGLTIPSLWWIRDQFVARNQSFTKLVEEWQACPSLSKEPGRVDLLVNRQLWSLLDYLERYAFIHEFGSAARDFGYNIRILDNRRTASGTYMVLGTYACDFSMLDLASLQNTQTQFTTSSTHRPPNLALAELPPCVMFLDATGKARVRVSPNPFGGGVATPPGTDW